VAWKVEATNEFRRWYESLSEQEQDALDRHIGMLERFGPALGRPYADTIRGSRHPHVKELRTGTLRSLFAFDPCRTAIMLIGGDKRGAKRFYDRMIWIADRLYDAHLTRLSKGRK
jgi:hypothetical protein